MRGWIVLAAVLLLLFLLGQLRLGAVGEYGPGGAGAWFRAGPVRIRLYPRRRSGPSKKEKAPKPGKEHPAGEACGGGLLELMKELARGGMTMVCVTHEMGFAREVANCIIFIDEGIVKVDKPPKEFFANPENERLKAFLSKVL